MLQGGGVTGLGFVGIGLSINDLCVAIRNLQGAAARAYDVSDWEAPMP